MYRPGRYGPQSLSVPDGVACQRLGLEQMRLCAYAEPCAHPPEKRPGRTFLLYVRSAFGVRAVFQSGASLRVSRPGEFHPQPLAEPDMNVSAHPAPIIQPLGMYPNFQCTNADGFTLAIRSSTLIVRLR